MQKTILFLFLISVTALAACAVGPNYVTHDKSKPVATVIMPVFYVEAAPYKSITGRTGVQVKKYFVSTVFQNRETGEKMTTGLTMGSRYNTPVYMASNFAPGRYDLVSFTIGGRPKNYDGEKCGRIGFEAGSGDTIILKGVKPAAITTQGLFKARWVSLISFETMPKDMMATIKTDHPGLDPRRTRVIAPVSDNPAAFTKCVEETAPKFSTLMD